MRRSILIAPGRLSSGLLLLAVAVAVAGPAVAQTAIRPGYWETTNAVTAPIRSSSTEKKCITPADVDKFMAGPSNRHYTCTYPTKVIAHGKISLKGTCASKKGQKVAVSGEGTYTPTSFQLSADIATDFLGIPVSGKATTEAHRIGDICPDPNATSPAPVPAAPTDATPPSP
jgi:hypothetical protein